MSTEREEQEYAGCYDAGFKAGIKAGMAITVDRCLNAAPVYEGNVADLSWAVEAYQRNIRALSPHPNYIDRERLWARLIEHAQTCRRLVGIPGVDSFTETKCCKDSPCYYRQDIERQLAETEKPKEDNSL